MRKIQSLQKLPFPAPDCVTKMVPAPTEGWDAISPLATMDPKRAPILTNWVPRPGWVELRKGYTVYASVAAKDVPVETIMVFRDGTGEKMFAAAGGSIYDVTTSTPSTAASGFGSSRWQTVSFTPSAAGTYLFACNGVDALQQCTRALGWAATGITGLPSGYSTSTIINIWAAKRRLWFVLGSATLRSTMAAFMPVDAIAGDIAGTLDLGAMMTKGGYLISISSWTIDGGAGPGDYVVFLSSRGQAILYSGTDPENAQAWSLVGTFDLSPPISLRCMTRVASDVGVITQQGVIPISQALPFDPSADRSVSITARIQNAMALASHAYKDYYGWQFISYPDQQLAILNIPISENVQQEQYVMNTLTGAWCRFTGWNANCFEVYTNKLYFGDNKGNVCLGWDTSTDNGLPINADMQCAYNYFDDPGRIKRMTMIQPLLVVNGQFTPTMAIDADFIDSGAIAPITIFESGAQWGTAVWGVSKWPHVGGSTTPYLSTEVIGRALAVHMSVQAQPTGDITLQVNAFNAIMELGGFILLLLGVFAALGGGSNLV